MKTRKAIGSVLIKGFYALIITLLMLTAVPAIEAEAAIPPTNVYVVADSDNATRIWGVINGTYRDGWQGILGNQYDGIQFNARSSDYNYDFGVLVGNLNPDRDFTFVIYEGANVVINRGFNFVPLNEHTIEFMGGGSLTITTTSVDVYGIYYNPQTALSRSVTLNFRDIDFYIKNTNRYGIYVNSSVAATMTINIIGGYFEVSNCGNNNVAIPSGGISFNKGSLNISDGAEVVIKNNGILNNNALTINNTVGDIYADVPIIVSDLGTTLTVSTTSQVQNSIEFGNNGSLRIDADAVVTVNMNSTLIPTSVTGLSQVPETSRVTRGIAGSSNAVNVDNGGQLIINGNDKTSGLRNVNVYVANNGILHVSGFDHALDGSFLRADGFAHVTLEGDTIDNGTHNLNNSTDGSIIMGGSVQKQPEVSVVSGVLTDPPVTSKVATTPINDNGEELVRFDLNNYANSTISIAAHDTNPAYQAYNYVIGNDHANDTAYVWAPAVTVTFWHSENDYTQNSSNRYQTNHTIRGNTITDVGGTAPAVASLIAPAGQVFSNWIDADTGLVFDPATAVILKDTHVYPEFYTPARIIIPTTPASAIATGVDDNLMTFVAMTALSGLLLTVLYVRKKKES